MFEYHGKDVWGPGRHPQTNPTLFGNVWNELKKIEFYPSTKSFLTSNISNPKPIWVPSEAWEWKKLFFSKNKKDMKNLSREVLDNHPKLLWLQGFVRRTKIDGLVNFWIWTKNAFWQAKSSLACKKSIFKPDFYFLKNFH